MIPLPYIIIWIFIPLRFSILEIIFSPLLAVYYYLLWTRAVFLVMVGTDKIDKLGTDKIDKMIDMTIN